MDRRLYDGVHIAKTGNWFRASALSMGIGVEYRNGENGEQQVVGVDKKDAEKARKG